MRRTLPLLTLCFLALTGCGTRYSVVSDPAARPHDVPAAPVAVALQAITTDGDALPRVSGSSFVSALGQALRDTKAFSAVSLPGEAVPAGARIVEVRATATLDNHSGRALRNGMIGLVTLYLAAPFLEQQFTEVLTTEAVVAGRPAVTATTTGEMFCGVFQVTDVRTGLTAKVEADNATTLAAQIITLVYGEVR